MSIDSCFCHYYTSRMPGLAELFVIALVGLNPSVSQTVFERFFSPNYGFYYEDVCDGPLYSQFLRGSRVGKLNLGPVDVSVFFNTPFRVIKGDFSRIYLEPAGFEGEEPFTLLFSERGHLERVHVGGAFGRRIGGHFSFLLTADYADPGQTQGESSSQFSLSSDLKYGRLEMPLFLMKHKMEDTDELLLLDFKPSYGPISLRFGALRERYLDLTSVDVEGGLRISGKTSVTGRFHLDSRAGESDSRGFLGFNCQNDIVALEVGSYLSSWGLMPSFGIGLENPFLSLSASRDVRFNFPAYSDTSVEPGSDMDARLELRLPLTARLGVHYGDYSRAKVFCSVHQGAEGGMESSYEWCREARFLRASLQVDSVKLTEAIGLWGAVSHTLFADLSCGSSTDLCAERILRKWDVSLGLNIKKVTSDTNTSISFSPAFLYYGQSLDGSSASPGLKLEVKAVLFQAVLIEFAFRRVWNEEGPALASFYRPGLLALSTHGDRFYSLKIAALLWD